jgi:pimeloyl-ACP methyl ester carboxylesterase
VREDRLVEPREELSLVAPMRETTQEKPMSTTEDAAQTGSDNELDRGGHFAAWEQPQLFSEEMRASFRSLR